MILRGPLAIPEIPTEDSGAPRGDDGLGRLEGEARQGSSSQDLLVILEKFFWTVPNRIKAVGHPRHLLLFNHVTINPGQPVIGNF